MRGKKEALTDFVFLGSKITLDGDWSHEIKMCLLLGGKLWQVRQHIKKQRHHFANKSPCSQSYGFSGSHVRMWELDYKESWVPKNWYFWTVMLEKTLESLLDIKEIQLVHPKGNQSWFPIREGLMLKLQCLATWCKELTHLKRPLCWERLKVGEGDNRGRDGWMASLTQWTWVWVSSGS